MLAGLIALVPLSLAGVQRTRPPRPPAPLAPQALQPVVSAGKQAAVRAAVRTGFDTAWLDRNPGRDLAIHAAAATLVDLDSHQVLWQRDMRSPRAPASLAKTVTAMVAVDLASLDQAVTVPAEATAVEPNVMGLTAGEVITVRILLQGLLLDSGNDAAETLARALIPRDRFLRRMNAKAAELGMSQSSFSNPSGLDDSGLRSSAYDLALAAAALIRGYPQLMEIAGTREQPIPAGPAHKAFEPYNLNKLLWNYPGATGLKTGFTDEAGGCVIATATRGDRHLVAVAMHSDVFFTDAARLLDYGFARPRA